MWAEEVGDLWERWMRAADRLFEDDELLTQVFEAQGRLETESPAPKPIISKDSGPRFHLADTARRSYPGYRVVKISREPNLDQAVDVELIRGNEIGKRLFDPRTGSDLGDVVPMGMWLVSKVLDLHDNLLAEPTGRKVNDVGALSVLALAATGLTLWWPGVRTWRRSLTLHRGVGWKRLIWHFHSMIGFWSLGFMLVFGFSGIYLAIPEKVQDLADWVEPPPPPTPGDGSSTGSFIGLHICISAAFKIGIPCSGPGSLRSDDKGHLGPLRTGSRSHGRGRRDHVVESRAAPDSGKSSTAGFGFF